MSNQQDVVYDRSKYAGAIIVPIVFGPNRLRGSQLGAMVSDDGLPGQSTERLRAALRRCAQKAGFEADAAWLTKTVAQLLGIFEHGYANYRQTRVDQVGFVYEGALPSGDVLLMAEVPVLRRLGLLH